MPLRLSSDDTELVTTALEFLSWIYFGHRCKAILDDHYVCSCTILPEDADLREWQRALRFTISQRSPEAAALELIRDLSLDISNYLCS